MDERDFEKMMGRKPEPEESEEEREAREARLGTDEATFEDLFHPSNVDRIFDAAEERKRQILEHYGLNDRPDNEEIKRHAEAMLEMLSDEQREQLRKAEDAYIKRRLPQHDKGDWSRSLLSFAATNEPAVLRRHIWRLQRGMDEPMFGPRDDLPIVARGVREYEATIKVTLCDRCVDELREETEARVEEEDAPRNPYTPEKVVDSIRSFRLHYMGKHYFYKSHTDESWVPYCYIFRVDDARGDAYVESDTSRDLFGHDEFPYSPPKECSRCGTSDVDFWRERYGEA